MAKLNRATRSRIMSAIRSRGNRTTELAFRRLLVSGGLTGWRRHPSDLPGRPDFVFRHRRLAIFLDGCFWHSCNRCPRNLKPSTNRGYWGPKLARNKARDLAANRALRKLGWKVLRVWEHELRIPERVLKKVVGELKRSGTKRLGQSYV